LGMAIEKPGADKVRFIRHDLSKRLPFSARSFDRVISSLVLEHLARLEPFFREIFRFCRLGGLIVITAMHPAMYLKGSSARFTDPATGRKVLPRSHVQSIADYLNAAVRAGLRLEALEEHAASAALAKRYPRARKYAGWPMLVAMRLRR
jgi:ubiquinone/menaquinone biosynthesis C-methylase UbiE